MESGYSIASIAVVLLFILLNGSLYGFGAAIQNLSEANLEKDWEEGNKTAGRLLRVISQPTGFVYTVQIVTHLSGMVTGALILGRVRLWTETLALGILLLIVLLSFGIVIPKRCAVKKPERWAYMTYPVVAFIYVPMKPFAMAVAGVSWIVLKCFGVELKRQEEDVTEEEIMLMVNEGHEKGVLEASEAEMITNIFQLDSKQAGDIMTHRLAVKALDGAMTLREAVHYILNEAGNSRYPVFGNDIDDILGVLHIRDALTFAMREEMLDLPISGIKGLLRDAHVIPETRGIDDLFKDMQSQKLHMAVVVDEYGQTAGIVTMEDILEEIVGNIQDEYDEEEEFVSSDGDGVYIFNGMTPLDEVIKTLEIHPPEELVENYETLNGFLIELLGRIPGEGEESIEIPYEKYLFTVIRMENKTIGTVRVTTEERRSEEA